MRTAVWARAISEWEATLTGVSPQDNEERFLRLAGRELDRTYRLAGLLLGDQDDAEDATQEALLRAWRSITLLRDPDGFQAWFDRIVVNVCRDRLRRRKRIRFVPIEQRMEPRSPVDPFRAVLDRDQALRALELLNAHERIVVVLRYWADLTLADVAQRTGWPLGTVKSRLHRALLRMAGSLELDGHTDERTER